MYKLPLNIIKQLKLHKTSLGENPCFPPEDEYSFDYKMTLKHFEETCEKIKKIDDINIENQTELKNSITSMLSQCQKLEEPIKEQLESLCFDIINDMFEIPEDVEFECTLEGSIPSTNKRIVPDNTDDIEFDGIEDINRLNLDVYKRRMINSIIQGAAAFYSHKIENYINYIYKLNPKLIELYNNILTINDYLLFFINDFTVAKSKHLSGTVDVYLGDENTSPKIVSKGVIFPILLSESLKGFMELFASHGLPLNKKDALYVIKKSDFLLAEPWDIRLGIPIWNIFEKYLTDKDSKIIPLFLMELFSLDTNNFNENVKEILANTKKGKDVINNIFKEIYFNIKKDKFNTHIQTKNDSVPQINDEYFTSKELIES